MVSGALVRKTVPRVVFSTCSQWEDAIIIEITRQFNVTTDSGDMFNTAPSLLARDFIAEWPMRIVPVTAAISGLVKAGYNLR